MTTCPACGDQIEEPVPPECPRCHTRLQGATHSFEPVGAAHEPGVSIASEHVTEGPALVVRKGAETGERFVIDRERLTIGRDPDSDIFLNDVTVSRSHAVIEAAGQVVSIEDVGSLNGTYVNGVRVDKAPLTDGDILQVGMFQMVYVPGSGR